MSSSPTAGKPIKCKAMVARAAKQPLVCEEITVDPPKEGEVRVKVSSKEAILIFDFSNNRK